MKTRRKAAQRSRANKQTSIGLYFSSYHFPKVFIGISTMPFTATNNVLKRPWSADCRVTRDKKDFASSRHATGDHVGRQVPMQAQCYPLKPRFTRSRPKATKRHEWSPPGGSLSTSPLLRHRPPSPNARSHLDLSGAWNLTFFTPKVSKRSLKNKSL